MRALITAWRALVCVGACAGVWAAGFDDSAAASERACELAGASTMAFGAYDPMSSAPLDIQGQVSYRCYYASFDPSDRAPLIVQISLSPGFAGSFNRRMQGFRDVLRYNLYTDPQRSTIWGNGSAGTAIYSQAAQANNRVVTVPVFGRVFGGQDVRAGGYLDYVIVTLDF